MCGLDAKELCSGIFSDVMDTMGYRGADYYRLSKK